MKKFLKVTLACALAAWMFGVAPADAQIRKTGITGASFLKIGVGARAVALGSAYTTVSGDVNQMFWNPAGVAITGGKTQVTFSYNQWIADLNHVAAGISHDFGTWGTWGIGAVKLGVSDIEASRDVVPSFLAGSFTPFDNGTSATYDYSDTAINITWALNFTDKLSMGITGKYINQSIDGESASAGAIDVGAVYKIGYKGARLGARISNLGGDLKFYEVGAPLPLIFSYGAAIDLVSNEEQGMRLTAFADANKPQDNEQLFFTSGELALKEMFFVRGGYKLNYSGTTDQKTDEITRARIDAGRSEEGFTLGAGVKIPVSNYKIAVDYAFTEFGILDSVHRVSMNLDF